MLRRVLMSIVLIVMPAATKAYESLTHDQMTRAAINLSVLREGQPTLSLLGVEEGKAFPSVRICDEAFSGRSLLDPPTELVADGVRAEDCTKPLVRVMNHFFDPHGDRALEPCTQLCFPPSCGLFSGCKKAPDWALEDLGQIAVGPQNFSLADGRNYLEEGLTAAGKADRDVGMGGYRKHKAPGCQPTDGNRRPHALRTNLPGLLAAEAVTVSSRNSRAATSSVHQEKPPIYSVRRNRRPRKQGTIQSWRDTCAVRTRPRLRVFPRPVVISSSA
jgi:hypothetical protein